MKTRDENGKVIRLYKCWQDMKSRCYNKNNKDYYNYGNRGITVCDEWINNYKNFYEWSISNGYTDTLTIDRINSNGNYEPSNCRWATHKQQGNNTSRNKKIEFSGVTRNLSEWCEILNLNYNTIRSRINRDKIDPLIALGLVEGYTYKKNFYYLNKK